MDTIVRDVPERHRFELVTTDGTLAGFAEYRLHGDTITFVHTVIESAFEGQGLGSTLIRAALDDARAKKRAVVAVCPFVLKFIERHSDYADLVAEQHRAELHLPAGEAAGDAAPSR